MNFGPFWVKLGVSDVTKGVKISKYRNSDIIIGFLAPKNVPIPNLRSKRSFYRVLLCFRWIWGHFGSFWVKLGVSDVTKGVKIYKFRNSDIIIGFLAPKNIPIPIFSSKQSFYHVLLCFRWILSHLAIFLICAWHLLIKNAWGLGENCQNQKKNCKTS